MADLFDLPLRLASILYSNARAASPLLLLVVLVATVLIAALSLYIALFILAPIPRPPHPSEKTYITTTETGATTSPKALPCWHDKWLAHKTEKFRAGDLSEKDIGLIEDAEVAMSVVIPAYNEEERLEIMLEEAVAFLDATYGRPLDGKALQEKPRGRTTGLENGNIPAQIRGDKTASSVTKATGYEIILVDDGSTDKTVDVALKFSKKYHLHDVMRIVSLKENRGKGGAVTHGFRHVRGEHAIFADADGASTFGDLGKLVEGCKEVHDDTLRGIAVGSRAHLVGSEAVVKRSMLRNALMHSFHVLLRLLTPAATSQIRDTQCGFKLFSRASLPHIIPYMHAEGWIFDVEMLMLAESAPLSAAQRSGPGIKVAEVPIGWKEVGGSKLNVMWASLGMAWGLALLRACWASGVYRRR